MNKNKTRRLDDSTRTLLAIAPVIHLVGGVSSHLRTQYRTPSRAREASMMLQFVALALGFGFLYLLIH